MLCLPLAVAILIPQGAPDPQVVRACSDACEAAVKVFSSKGLKQEQFAAGVAVLDPGHGTFRFGSVRGDQAFYPASVVKLFYLAYAADCFTHHRLKRSDELDRGIHDMIVDSVNDATAYVLETITDATSGSELPDREMKKWINKRLAVNRWYASMGYKGVNACNRTWNEGPYGRERIFLGKSFENRNSLTVDACVRLMSEIALGTALPKVRREESTKWCDWMKGLLSRGIPADDPKADYQAKEFIGKVLPSGSRLWSKAGYTETARHDVADVRLPDGREMVIAIFTKNCSQQTDLIPFISKKLLETVR